MVVFKKKALMSGQFHVINNNIMTIKFHNLDLQDTKENRAKIENVSYFNTQWYRCVRHAILYDMTYKQDDQRFRSSAKT